MVQRRVSVMIVPISRWGKIVSFAGQREFSIPEKLLWRRYVKRKATPGPSTAARVNPPGK
jgi:hypothetical protein